MSGIAGIVQFEPGRADERSLRSLTDSLSFRGPDRQHTWVDAHVGFGHATLRTTEDVDPHPQPATLDGAVWITADARIDGRAELVRHLESSADVRIETRDDALLILHAYNVWGASCVDYLLGDFAFAIWDSRTRRVFCARDHFGVKPFYYAAIPNGITFSNTLNSLRMQAGVRSTLNDVAVADFLLFGINQDETSTIFADIKRLAPAHTLTFDERGLRTKRYWSLPIEGCVRYRRSREYVEQFTELLQAAVADRLRSSRVGVWMSGGLDSTSLTAVARQILSKSARTFEVRAHTIVYDELFPDEEGRYASAAATSIGVPNDVFVADSHRPFDGWNGVSRVPPEPSGDPFLSMRTRQLRDVAAHSRMLLSGEGGDELLWTSRAWQLARNMRFVEFATDLGRCFLHRRRPSIGLRPAFKRRWARAPAPPFPEWINPAFATRLGLRERWERVHRPGEVDRHPLRPEAHRRLSSAPWSWYFESTDPGVTGIPVEVRYPFLDLRLVKYVLSIPPIPWCVDKEILRLAMRGTLPESVRLRPKTPLGGDPLVAALKQPARLTALSETAPQLASYVNTHAAPIQMTGYNGDDPWLDVRPTCLSYWLNHARAQMS